MNIRELRISNLFQNDEKEIWKVVKVLREGCIVSRHYEIYMMNYQMQPILIDEEWLLKCGFTQDGKYLQLPIPSDYGAVLIADTLQKSVTLSDCDSGKIGRDIEYVHDLQNLYFSLTGIELEVVHEIK